MRLWLTKTGSFKRIFCMVLLEGSLETNCSVFYCCTEPSYLVLILSFGLLSSKSGPFRIASSLAQDFHFCSRMGKKKTVYKALRKIQWLFLDSSTFTGHDILQIKAGPTFSPLQWNKSFCLHCSCINITSAKELLWLNLCAWLLAKWVKKLWMDFAKLCS